MSEDKKHSPFFFVLIASIIQVVIFKYLSFFPWLSINLLPGVMVLSWQKHTAQKRIVLAFILGLLIDILADGIVGLNAASLVLAAALLPLFNKQKIRLMTVLLIANAIFFLLYVVLDLSVEFSFGQFVLTYVCSVGASTVLDFFLVRGGVYNHKTLWINEL